MAKTIRPVDAYILRMAVFHVKPSQITHRVNGGLIEKILGDYYETSQFVVGGDWDKNCKKFKIIDNEKMRRVQRSFEQFGYDLSKVSHYIRVCIGRNGEILFFDGNHRLSALKKIGYNKPIPVQIQFIHEEFAKNNPVKRHDIINHLRNKI